MRKTGLFDMIANINRKSLVIKGDRLTSKAKK
jgi:hypothetical protein